MVRSSAILSTQPRAPSHQPPGLALISNNREAYDDLFWSIFAIYFFELDKIQLKRSTKGETHPGLTVSNCLPGLSERRQRRASLEGGWRD